VRSLSTRRRIRSQTQQLIPPPIAGGSEGEAHDMNSPSHQSERADAARQTPTRVEQVEIQAGPPIQPTPEVDPNSGVISLIRFECRVI
jgi:hypothetical protein